MEDAFGVSKRRIPRSMPKQYRRAEARNAGQRLRLRAHGITHPNTKTPLPKPPIWKRPGYQLAAGAAIAGALGGTMYSYHKGRKKALENPAPAMPVGQYGPVGKSAKSDRNWHTGFAAGNAAVGGLAAASAFKAKGGTNRALMGGWAGLSGLIAAREAQQARKAHLRMKKHKVSKAGFTSAPGFTKDFIRVGRKGKYLLKRKPARTQPLGFHPESKWKVTSSGEISPAKNHPPMGERPGSYALSSLTEEAPKVQGKYNATVKR